MKKLGLLLSTGVMYVVALATSLTVILSDRGTSPVQT